MMIVLESRQPGKAEFGIRSRMGRENMMFRDRKLTLVDLLKRTEEVLCRWQVIEPLTEFRITVKE